jgi:hypothetical protein
MKYWLLTIAITVGDYEFYQKSLHKCKGEFDCNDNDYIRNFYADSEEEEQGVYSANGGEIQWCAHDIQELTKKEYEMMRNYI